MLLSDVIDRITTPENEPADAAKAASVF